MKSKNGQNTSNSSNSDNKEIKGVLEEDKDENNVECIQICNPIKESLDLPQIQEENIKWRAFKFIDVIVESFYMINNSTTFYSYNMYKKLKVEELFTNIVDIKSKMYDLLDQEVCINSNIFEQIKTKLQDICKNLNSRENIQDLIAKQIQEEFERFLKNAKNTESVKILTDVHLNHVEIYIEKLKRDFETPLENILIKLYTNQGFLIYALNTINREGSMLDSNLLLYFILLKASIAIAQKNLKNSGIEKHTILDREYYRLYRGDRIHRKIHESSQNSTEDPKNLGNNQYLKFGDFLSTTRDRELAKKYALESILEEEHYIRVLYTFLIPQIIVDDNPTLMCSIQECSCFPEEKEVLLPSCPIFEEIFKEIFKEIKFEDTENNVKGEIEYHDITLLFVSNGFDEYDKEIRDEVAKYFKKIINI